MAGVYGSSPAEYKVGGRRVRDECHSLFQGHAANEPKTLGTLSEHMGLWGVFGPTEQCQSLTFTRAHMMTGPDVSTFYLKTLEIPLSGFSLSV